MKLTQSQSKMKNTILNKFTKQYNVVRCFFAWFTFVGTANWYQGIDKPTFWQRVYKWRISPKTAWTLAHGIWLDGYSKIAHEDYKKIFQKAADMYAEQSNSHKQVVSGKRPDYETIRATAIDYTKDVHTAPDCTEQMKRYCTTDFIAGAQWALSQVACASGGEDTVAERWQYEAYKNGDYLMIYKDGKLFDKIPRARKSSEEQP